MTYLSAARVRRYGALTSGGHGGRMAWYAIGGSRSRAGGSVADVVRVRGAPRTTMGDDR